MKKILSIALASLMLLLAVACGGTTAPAANTSTTDTQTSATAAPAAQSEQTETNQQPAAAETKYVVPTQEPTFWQEKAPEDLQDESMDNKTAVYQFVGFSSQDRNISCLMELYDDGFARIYQHSENQEGLNFIYYGYWTPVDDEYLFTAFACYSYEGTTREDMGVYNGDLCTLDYSYELYEQDGRYSFSLNAPLGFQNGGQYVRSAEMEGDGAVQYTLESWIAYADETWGGQNPAAEPAAESEAAEPAAEEAFVVPNHALYIEDFIADINPMLHSGFYAEATDWGTAISGNGSYEPTDSEDVLFVMAAYEGKPFTISIRANGTYEFEYPGMVKEYGTWTWANWQFTLMTDGGQVFNGAIMQ